MGRGFEQGAQAVQTRPKLKEIVENGGYGVVRRAADFALLKKGYDTPGNERLISDWNL
jgi:hypothetical protein